MTPEQEQRLGRPFGITPQERELLYNYHGGQESMIYATASSDGLRRGDRRPRNSEGYYNDAEWMQRLLLSLNAELHTSIEIAKKDGHAKDLPILERLQRRVRARLDLIEAAPGEKAAPTHDLDIEEVLEHYIVIALGSSNDESTPQGGVPLDRNYGRDDIDPEAVERMRADVTKFVNDNHALLSTWSGQGGASIEQQAGHDFWLTRNGHGCGVWESEWGDVGDALTEAAKAFGECDLIVADGRIEIL